MRLHRTVTPMSRPKWRAASIIAGAAVSALGAGWVSGCSVVYDLSTEQCSTDTDCNDRGGVFQGLACIDNLCQEPPLTGCQSNAECIDDFGDGLRPWACIDRECVDLLTTECPLILPQTNEGWRDNLRTSNPLILAGTGQVNSSAALDPITMNYELALTELKGQGVTIGGRAVVMLGCNTEFESTDQLDAMMDHLATTVKVPGIVSALAADDLQRAFTQKGDAANMFFMSAVESDPTLATIQDRSLVWHIGPATDFLARAYAPLLTRTLAHLNPSTTVKVATVLTPNYRFLTNMVSTIEADPDEYGLLFNGQSVSANRAANNYRGVSIDANPELSLADQVADLLEMLPTVVISAADTQLVQRLIPALEDGWPTGTDAPPRPFYIMSPYNYNDPRLRLLVDTNPSLITRMAGINGAAAEDPREYNAYLGRWDFLFEGSEDVRGYENYYDAAYYLLYSAAGAGQSLQSGLDLARGMSRLLAGTELAVGPDNLAQGVATLAVGGATIQLNGTLGPPDFNASNGTRESVGSVWCVDAAGFHADVLRYVPNADPTQATLTGNFPCIDGF